VDGGAAANDWLMTFQADILGVPVTRPQLLETTALGAAGLAGLAEDVWKTGDDFLAAQGEATHFCPGMDDNVRELHQAGWQRALGAATSWSRSGGE
jgi:glycerol kinase